HDLRRKRGKFARPENRRWRRELEARYRPFKRKNVASRTGGSPLPSSFGSPPICMFCLTQNTGCNSGAAMTVLNAGGLACSGVGQCPECRHGCRVRDRPETPHKERRIKLPTPRRLERLE